VSEGKLANFDGAFGWINSVPLTPESLHGADVLLESWTYTCINWLRTLSYVRAWAETYADHGLVVIGVYTPEFPFEADGANVERAVTELRIGYAAGLDPDYAVWEAYGNHYWPALYLADAECKIHFHVFGEGGYEESEQYVQRLLREEGNTGVPGDLVDVDAAGRGAVTEPRLYQLIRQPSPIEDRTVEIVFDEPGAEAYVFTFG
jgi:hypothetical protein